MRAKQLTHCGEVRGICVASFGQCVRHIGAGKEQKRGARFKGLPNCLPLQIGLCNGTLDVNSAVRESVIDPFLHPFVRYYLCGGEQWQDENKQNRKSEHPQELSAALNRLVPLSFGRRAN